MTKSIQVDLNQCTILPKKNLQIEISYKNLKQGIKINIYVF